MNDKIKIFVVFSIMVIIIIGFVSLMDNRIKDIVYVGTVKEFEIQKINHHILSVGTIAVVTLNDGKKIIISEKCGAQ